MGKGLPGGGEIPPEAESIPIIGERLIKSLLAALKGVTLYAIDHPACQASFNDLTAAIDALGVHGDPIVIGVVGTEVVVNGLPLEVPEAAYVRLVEQMERIGIEKLTIRRAITPDEVRELVLALATEQVEDYKAFNAALARRGCRNAEAGKLAIDRRKRDSRGFQMAEKDYATGFDAIQEINEQLRSGGKVRSTAVSSVASMLVKGVVENQGSLMTVLDIHNKDEYTATHCLDVALLTLLQVRQLGLDDTTLGSIATAAILHDLGKLLIPDDLLNKAGALTDDEWVTMRKHPVMGAELIHDIPGVDDLAIIVSFEHHQKYDCSGYPSRMGRRPLNEISYMAAISDAYDAMRSRRPYQKELSPEQAASILLKGAGTSFHPGLVKRFVGMVGVYGLGNAVKLSTGEFAVVEKNNRHDPYCPVIRIVADPLMRPVDSHYLDLSAMERDGSEISIECSVPIDDTLRDLIRESRI
jgi:HD-GYP domain-containing protein (c-di-GMP phosphodiesterase class II)